MTDRLEHFTNRDAQIAAFDALWSHNHRWVLAFHGLSGNGKSTLIDYLIETRCLPQELPFAILDFEGSRGVTLRTDWRALLGAIAAGWGLAAHPAYTRAREAALRQYETVRSSLQVQLEQKADHGQISDSPISIDAGQSEALRQADNRARAQTAEALLQAAAATHGRQRLLLFLDTYERLAEMADKKYAGWLWSWLGQAAAQLPGLRVVVGSRTALAGLSRRERQQAELPLFSRADSDALLQKLGVTDPAWRAAIYDRLANGHPLLTEMAGDLWRQAHQSGRPLPADDIPTLAGQEPAVEWLTGRILDRLPEPLKSGVRWAALLRRFNQETLADLLLHTGAPPLTDDDFDTLRRYSFVAPARVGRGWACHDLLRRVQNSYLRVRKPAAWQTFHEKAAAYFAASEAAAQEDALEALYHGLMAGDEAAAAAWPQAAYEAHFQFDYAHWAALLEVVESPELSPPPGLAAEGRRWRGMYHRWRYELDEALGSYEAALGLFRQVGSRLGEANTLQAIGDVQQFKKELDEALGSYEAALGLFRQVGDRLGEANTRKAIGDVQQFKKELDEALGSYEAALGLFRQVGDRLGEANTLQAIGDVQQFKKELDEALGSYEAALGLFRQVGDRLGEANTRKAIGDVQRFRDENDEALGSYEAALGLFRQVGDRLGEANTRKAIGDVQRFRAENDEALGSYEAALGLFRQVGDRLGEANTRKAIGDVQRFRDENDEALGSYEAALGLFRQVGSRLGEANTLQAIGDVQQFKKELDEALGSYEAALGLFRQVGSRLGEANTLDGLGQFFLRQQNWNEAEKYLQTGLELYQTINSRYDIAWSLYFLGQVEEGKDNSTKAAEYYQTALRIFEEIQIKPYIEMVLRRLDNL